MSGDGGGGGHGGADQVGASTASLTALEVAVAGGGATLAGLQNIRIHAEAHGASGLAPFGSGFEEDAVETLALGELLNRLGAGNDQHLNHGADLMSLDDPGGIAQVFQASIGAGADKDAVDGQRGERLAGSDAHVLKSIGDGKLFDFVLAVFRTRRAAGDGRGHSGRGAPGDPGLQSGGIEVHDAIELRAGIAGQSAPVGDGFVPLLALGSVSAALDVGEGGFIGGDHAGARASSQWSCCRGSCGHPWRARGWPGRRTRWHSRCRRRCRSDG